MNLYKIDGGIGKNIAFTGLIPELVEKDGGQICIESAYPEVFINIPGIAMIYNANEPKDMKKFYSYFKNVYAHDPYIGNMWKGNVHIVDAWASMFGLPEKDLSLRMPIIKVYPSEEEINKIKEALGDDPYYVIQIAGGQSPYEIRDINNLPAYENNAMRAGRNMIMLDDLYNELHTQFPNHKMVQFGLPNEPKLKDAIQLNMNYINWFYVFTNASFFVGIDSMMQHYMASIKKPGVVFWDMNIPQQFGWYYDGIVHADTIIPGGVNINKALANRTLTTISKYLTSTTISE